MFLHIARGYPTKLLGSEITLIMHLAQSVEIQLMLLSAGAGIKDVTVTPGRDYSKTCLTLIGPYSSFSPPLSIAIDAEAHPSYKHSITKYHS